MNTILKSGPANPTMQIGIAEVRQQTVFHWRLAENWLSALLENCEYPVEAICGDCHLVAEPHSRGFRIRGEVQFKAKTDCNVCLNKVILDLSADIDTFMQPADAAEETQDELTPKDLDTEYYTGSTIVLDEFIGDSILLELPMIPKCNGPCQKRKGLVTADELEQRESTVDPRLRALADIQLSKES